MIYWVILPQKMVAPEVERLKGFAKVFTKLVSNEKNIDNPVLMADLCVFSMTWIHDNISYQGVAYRPLGLAKTGVGLPVSIAWLRINA